MPILGLQSSSLKISSEGLVSYPSLGSKKLERLYVEGNTIRDRVEEIFLVGCGLRGQARNPQNGWDDFWTYAESDAKIIRDYGFNSIRLAGCYWARIETSQSPDQFTYDVGYVQHIVDTVKAYGDQGIYVIIDLHTYATAEGMEPLAKFLPWSGTADYWTDEFFTDTGPTSAREHLKRVWLMLSDIFKNNWNVAGYDLLNEPHHEGTLSNQEIHDYWWDIADYVISALRANGDNHIVFVEESPWSTNCKFMTGKLNDPNVVYEPHWYQGLNLSTDPHSVLNNDLDWLRDYFGTASAYISTKMAEFNVPFVIGEFCDWESIHMVADSLEDIYLRNSLTVFRESPTMRGFWYHSFQSYDGVPNSSGWQQRLAEASADKPTKVHFM
jgi:aryl-phospho-beta-D-glucosidase BglC (GH1 family)